VPTPLRFTVLVLPVVELLENFNVPVAVPITLGSNCTWAVTAIVGFNVTGNVMPEKVKPAPVMVAALTVTGEVPVEVRVTGRVTGLPTGSSPKFKPVELMVSTGLVGLVPVPLRLTTIRPLAYEVLTMWMAPLAAPATVGLKLTGSVMDCPGFIVTGSTCPDSVKLMPDKAIEVIFTGAVPDDFKVSVCVDAVFNTTLPKASVLALGVKRGKVPVPLRFTVILPLVELLSKTVIAPVCVPVAKG
jgi:hypothetical protein